MAFLSFSEDFALYGASSVENLFILEFLPQAPGDCVRVYLYALMQSAYPGADDSLESLAQALRMTPEKLLNALRYWEQKGLLTGLSDNPLRFRFQSARSALQGADAESAKAYRYGDFNNRLQAVFGLLHPKQFAQAMEWVEELGLPPEVVLLMAERTNDMLTEKNGGKPRGVPYVFKVLNERALEWAKAGIKTAEDAERELSKEMPVYRLSRALLQKLGLRRNPTEPEIELAEKWIFQDHLTPEAVLAAADDTVSGRNPSFAYLDGILKSRLTGGESPEDLEKAKKEREVLKSLLRELGQAGAAPTDALLLSYRALLGLGFVPETLLRAAARVNRQGRHSFEDLEAELEVWLKKGLTTPEAADAYNQRRQALRAEAAQIFDRAGMDRKISEADLDQLEEWKEAASMEMILYAASCARGLKLPPLSISKRIAEWKEAGVTSLEAAKAFKRPGRGAASESNAPSKEPPRSAALNYAQREYSESFFSDFTEKLSGGTGGDGRDEG